MYPVSKEPSSALAVWTPPWSVFCHVMEAPGATVISAGSNFSESTLTMVSAA
jgi:hypothetical protein